MNLALPLVSRYLAFALLVVVVPGCQTGQEGAAPTPTAASESPRLASAESTPAALGSTSVTGVHKLEPKPGHHYVIRNVESGYVWDVTSEDRGRGQRVIEYKDQKQPGFGQYFEFIPVIGEDAYQIRVVKTNLMLLRGSGRRDFELPEHYLLIQQKAETHPGATRKFRLHSAGDAVLIQSMAGGYATAAGWGEEIELPIDRNGRGIRSGNKQRFRLERRVRPRIQLRSVHCKQTTESGSDEVYLKVILDGKVTRIPASGHVKMNENSKTERWNLNQYFEFDKSASVEVWEADGSSKDDFCGSADMNESMDTYVPPGANGIPTANFLYEKSLDGPGDYELSFFVLKRNTTQD